MKLIKFIFDVFSGVFFFAILLGAILLIEDILRYGF